MYRLSLMNSCWYEAPDERPSFSKLATELESMLSSLVGYMELNMTLTVTPGDDDGENRCIYNYIVRDIKLYI